MPHPLPPQVKISRWNSASILWQITSWHTTYALCGREQTKIEIQLKSQQTNNLHTESSLHYWLKEVRCVPESVKQREREREREREKMCVQSPCLVIFIQIYYSFKRHIIIVLTKAGKSYLISAQLERNGSESRVWMVRSTNLPFSSVSHFSNSCMISRFLFYDKHAQLAIMSFNCHKQIIIHVRHDHHKSGVTALSKVVGSQVFVCKCE